MMWTSLDTYCRQQDMAQLRAVDVTEVRPSQERPWTTVALQFGVSARGERAKSGTDQGVIVDWDEVARRLLEKKGKLKPLDKMFPMAQQQFHKWWYAAGQALGLELPPPHSLRHAGPSRDAFLHIRDLNEIQKRGRWEALSSVKRYSKPSWYAAVLARTPEAVMAAGEKILAGMVRRTA